METVHLIGAEDVTRAGYNIASAAEDMQRAADTMSCAFENQQRWMEPWLEHLEHILDKCQINNEDVKQAAEAGVIAAGKIINGDPVAVESDEIESPVGFSCSAISLAKQFHATYERLAPSFGYETRPETREFDCDSTNGKLMIAVCESIIQQNSPVSEDGECIISV